MVSGTSLAYRSTCWVLAHPPSARSRNTLPRRMASRQLAHVWRRICGVTSSSPARRQAPAKAVAIWPPLVRPVSRYGVPASVRNTRPSRCGSAASTSSTSGGSCSARSFPCFCHTTARACSRSTARQSSSRASDSRTPVPTRKASSGRRCGAAAACRRDHSTGDSQRVRLMPALPLGFWMAGTAHQPRAAAWFSTAWTGTMTLRRRVAGAASGRHSRRRASSTARWSISRSSRPSSTVARRASSAAVPGLGGLASA